MQSVVSEHSHPVSLFEVMSSSTGTLYVLVDKMLFSQIDEFWGAFSGRLDANWLPLYHETEYHHLSDSSPLLIEIKEGNPGETLFYWLLEQDEFYSRFGLVGVYPGSLKDIHQHWARWLTCVYPDGRDAMLRFYDITVIQKLWNVLTYPQKKAFYGQHHGLYAPYSLKSDEALITLADKVWFSEDEEKNETFTQLVLTQPQYDELFYEKGIKSLACTLHNKIAPNYGWLLPYVTVENRFWEGLAIAKEKYPKESFLAHETYALYRFYLSSHFDEHPDFKSLHRQFSLRESIRRFYERFQQEPHLLDAYKQEGWLGIEGHAELRVFTGEALFDD